IGATLLDQLTHCGEVLYTAYAEHPALSQVMFRETLFPQTEAERDSAFEPFLSRITELFIHAKERGELQRLPQQNVLAAQCFFAAYLLVLIGGLSGTLGTFDDAIVAA